jgi:predicted DNA-binding transcriptional regulator AlpA
VRLLTEKDASAICAISPATFRRLRDRHPDLLKPVFPTPGSARWTDAQIDAFINFLQQTSRAYSTRGGRRAS